MLAIDEHLEEIIDNISEYANEYNSDEIEEIKTEASTLRKQLGLLDKKTVVNKLSKIWARMSKSGVEVIKQFLAEGKKQLIQAVVKSFFEQGPHLLEQVTKHH